MLALSAAGSSAGMLSSLLTMLALLVLSGFFSGSETALFSLTGYERLQLRQGPSRMGRLADRLLRDPHYLLLTILFANLTVNVLIFTISSVIVHQLVRMHHSVLAGAVGVLTLLSIVLFGEILPKAAAYYLRVTISKTSALPLWLLSRTLHPALGLIHWLIVLPSVKLLTGPATEQQIRQEELLELFQVSREEKLLQDDQLMLLENVLELSQVRVRRIMTPRVDLICCRIDRDLGELQSQLQEKPTPVVLVYKNDPDDIVGLIHTRKLQLGQPGTLVDLLEPVSFVPEQQRVDQLVHFFRERRTDLAVVTDEYGGLAGLVEMEDIVEELLGKLASLQVQSEAKIQAIQPGRYTADGAVDIEDFIEQFDLPAPQMEIDTLAGLLMNLLGHLPEPGESVEFHQLILEASLIEQSRIKKITIIDRRDQRNEKT